MIKRNGQKIAAIAIIAILFGQSLQPIIAMGKQVKQNAVEQAESKEDLTVTEEKIQHKN